MSAKDRKVKPRSVDATPGPLRELAVSFCANHGAVAGFAVIATLLLLAVFADLIAPHPPALPNNDALLVPPVWQARGSWTYPLGTDPIGRDILSRLIHGARLSLAIVIVAILGPGIVNAMLAVAVVVLPHYVRIARAAVITELAKDYVTAAKVGGAGVPRLMLREVLPNCVAPLIVQATLGISTAILDAASLGFLGLGAQPPLPEWGTMLADAREFVLRAWWVVTFPGLMILLAVMAFNLVGDGLRDALDPKLKR